PHGPTAAAGRAACGAARISALAWSTGRSDSTARPETVRPSTVPRNPRHGLSATRPAASHRSGAPRVPGRRPAPVRRHHVDRSSRGIKPWGTFIAKGNLVPRVGPRLLPQSSSQPPDSPPALSILHRNIKNVAARQYVKTAEIQCLKYVFLRLDTIKYHPFLLTSPPFVATLKGAAILRLTG